MTNTGQHEVTAETDRKPFRVLVTGSRNTTEAQAAHVRNILLAACSEAIGDGRQVVIVQGECPYGGADLVAREWAELTQGVESEGHPAEWDRYGKAAGMRRNSLMVSLGADVCLAFPAPTSRGTWDCVRKAADAGIRCHVHPLLPGVHP